MDTELIAHSIDVMLYGIGVVFTFLILLVMATALMSTFVGRWFPEPEAPAGEPSKGAVDPLTRKIIQAAIDKHRGRQ